MEVGTRLLGEVVLADRNVKATGSLRSFLIISHDVI